MNPLEANAHWIILVLGIAACAVLLIAAIFLLMRLLARPRWYLVNAAATDNSLPGETLALKTGRSCGHCGYPTPGEPTHAIALERQTLFVYKCQKCDKETYLPSQ